MDTNSHVKGPYNKGLTTTGGRKTQMSGPGSTGPSGADRSGSWESDLLKMKALFDHPLYSTPRPAVPEDDWLLKVKPKVKASEKSSLMWKSDTQDGYEDIQWNRSSESHPPWLRFHLGITRWELYPHQDPNMELLVQHLATHRIVSAG
ncbi:extracellular serine/threonine protein kinase FAM20C-like [Nothobranchius furzeri]|uniref:Extracellular serine/threonine protein kinase FAM20C-like n=1 Tax=Nothobranchius furzeri TaxID=105023 RepID=A0A9D3BQY6_NOTFU|nr:extracellular serine/threonine protein kinase FAM20C-like [Nothobranchius furzeri]